MKYICVTMRIFLALLGGVPLFAQTTTENYVLSRTYRIKGAAVTTSTANTTYWGNPFEVQTQISYVDGLGKTSQTVMVSGNKSYKDIVSRMEYNNVYLPSKEYLPVSVNSSDGSYVPGASGAFYNSADVGDPTTRFWSETFYDNSPLGRVTEQKAPGIGLTTNGVRRTYRVFTSEMYENVYQYNVTATGDLAKTGDYPDNSLSVTETKDENDKMVKEFTDRHGRVVLKRVAEREDIYYVYDDKGRLCYVLQPEFQSGSASLADRASLFAFQYRYDALGRMTSKKVPGQNAFTMTYFDSNDLLEFMTDGNGKKFYYKYDGLNRQTEMGVVLNNTEEALVYTYYDNYSFTPFQNFDNTDFTLNDGDHFVGSPVNVTDYRLGLVTGSSTRVLNDDGNLSTSWLKTVNYYDYKGRVIQVFRQLFGLGADAFERVSYKLDFAGNITNEKTTQKHNSTTSYRLDKAYTYDQHNRLLNTTHQFTDGVTTKSYTHATNVYNEVGNLDYKDLHGSMQRLLYQHTPRGWLKRIRNHYGKTFDITLDYNNNGNINKLSWNTHTAEIGGSFDPITYDGANRMLAATSSELPETGISYDKNGNITSLNRSGAVTDNLAYNYSTWGNRLFSVEDASTNNNGVKTGTSSFGYDNNGNMTADGTKGAAISYNLLNLPAQVVLSSPSRTVQYTYDASGSKLKMSSPSAGTLYAGAFEYTVNGTLLRIGLEEGQLVRNSGGTYELNYYIRDHLGNVRQVLKEDQQVLQETQYYAFGLPVVKDGNDAANKYLYNGKEKQPETGWLDYGARMYMAEIGRWGVVDRFGEKYYSLSAYQYAANNPLVNIDVNGDSINVAALLNSADHATAFRQFASTKEGRTFLNNFASKGQKIMSADGKSIVYQAKSDGQYHKDGTNLVYKVGQDNKASSTGWSYGNSTGGINVNVDVAKQGFGTSSKLFNLTEAITHESLIHAIARGSDFHDDRGMNKSTIPEMYRQYGKHADHYNVSDNYIQHPQNSNSSFPGQAFKVLEQTNRNLNLGLSNRQIKQAMWHFDGSLVKFDKNGTPVRK